MFDRTTDKTKFCRLARCIATLFVASAPLLIAGCGGDNNNDSDIVSLAAPSPFPTFAASPTPTPTPSPGTTPAPLPTPVPTPTVSPTPFPVSGETLTQGNGVLAFTETSADANVPTAPLFTGDGGAVVGAKVLPLGTNGTSLQVFLSDNSRGESRSFSIVIADRGGVKEGTVVPLGAVVDSVKDPVAFVLLSVKPATDSGDAALKQWHSAGGGTVRVLQLTNGVARVRIENARMVPYTAARNNGQTGTFTINGAAFVALEAP